MRFIYLLFLLPVISASAQQTTIKEQVYFPSASSEIAGNDRQRLSKLVRSLDGKKVINILVLGHTDDIGSIEYNQQLSEKRARAVAAYLQGIIPFEIEVNFRGETAPAAENQDNAGRQLNRRTEIIITVAAPVTKAIPEPVLLQPYTREKEAQVFIADVKDTIRVKAKEGSSLMIPPGSLVYKNGKPVTGEVQISIREYLALGDMLLAGMHTEYEDGFLETRGTLDLLYLQGKDTLLINSAIPVEVRIPTKDPKDGMMVYASAGTDSAWKNTGRKFNLQRGFWAWPVEDDYRIEFLDGIKTVAEKIRVGRSYTDIIDPRGERSLKSGFKPENFVKKSEVTFTKVDSVTIKIRAKLVLRNYAKRKGIVTDTKLDTTFFVSYIVAEYSSPVTTTNFCNIDTYRKLAKRTYRINTPGVSGGRVTAVPSIFNTVIGGKEVKPGVYEVRVPEASEFCVTYTGTKDGRYYFGKAVVSAFSGVTPEIAVKEYDLPAMNSQIALIK